MSCSIRSELFDHAVLHSSVKWHPASVSSFLEELKLICPNRTLTQSKWIDSVSSRMPLSEAQCYWSMFMACRQSILGQVGEWMELGTLGIFLFCQAYAQARARADSSQHNEALVQNLANTMAIPATASQPSGASRGMSHRSQLMTSSSKLVRDNSSILQFVLDNISLLINIATLTLVQDTDFDVPKEALDRLDLIIATTTDQPFSSVVLSGRSKSIKSSALSVRIKSMLQWDENRYPPLDFNSSPFNNIKRVSNTDGALLVSNICKESILIDDTKLMGIRNSYIVNCSDCVIYVSVPLTHVSIIGCVDCEIVMMAVTGAVTVTLSEKVIIRAVTAHIRLENVIDTQLFIHASRVPLLTGDTRGIVIAPFNVVWSGHEELLIQRTTLHPDSSHATLWSQPVCACLSESPYILLQPCKYRLVFFPHFGSQGPPSLAVCLPQVYSDALQEKMNQVSNLKREIVALRDETSLTKVNAILSGHFRDWLVSNGKTKLMVDLIKQKM